MDRCITPCYTLIMIKIETTWEPFPVLEPVRVKLLPPPYHTCWVCQEQPGVFPDGDPRDLDTVWLCAACQADADDALAASLAARFTSEFNQLGYVLPGGDRI